MNIKIFILTCFIPFFYSDDKNIYKKNLSDNDMFAKYYSDAKKILKTMSPKEKIAQMFFIRYDYKKVVKHINNINFGGYVLFAINFQKHNKNSINKELEAIQKAVKIKLGLSVDEEGGTVVRISYHKQYRKEKFKSPQEYYKDGGIKKILEIEKEKRNLIKELNLNINLAPVADYTENSSSYIFERTLGQSITETEKYISEVVKEANKDNFTTCLKHFPGYGGNSDTHKGIAIDKRELEEFREKDFKPFIAGINQNVPMIMVSHNIIEKVDSKYPSSISAKIHKILREELNYTGIIITDDISMGAITQFVKNESVAITALLSGVDIILTSNNTQNYKELLEFYKNNEKEKEKLENAVTRILAYKLKYGIIPYKKDTDNGNKDGKIWKIIIIILAVVLVGGALVYFFVFKKKDTSQNYTQKLTDGNDC